jgi:hypothetical protein
MKGGGSIPRSPHFSQGIFSFLCILDITLSLVSPFSCSRLGGRPASLRRMRLRQRPENF